MVSANRQIILAAILASHGSNFVGDERGQLHAKSQDDFSYYRISRVYYTD